MASFRLIGYVVLNTLAALLGPVVLSSSLPPFHPHTGLGIIQKAWITSIVFAGFLGVVAVRAVRLNAAKTAGVGMGYSSGDLLLDGFELHAYQEHWFCDSLFRLRLCNWTPETRLHRIPSRHDPSCPWFVIFCRGETGFAKCSQKRRGQR